MYALGRGVPRDHVRAYMWMDIAAMQGDETARKNRHNMALKMTGTDVSKAQRLAREWMKEHQKSGSE